MYLSRLNDILDHNRLDKRKSRKLQKRDVITATGLNKSTVCICTF